MRLYVTDWDGGRNGNRCPYSVPCTEFPIRACPGELRRLQPEGFQHLDGLGERNVRMVFHHLPDDRLLARRQLGEQGGIAPLHEFAQGGTREITTGHWPTVIIVSR